MEDEKLKKAGELIQELNSLELTEDELMAINAGSTDVKVTYVNKGNDPNNSKVVIFEKNVADSF